MRLIANSTELGVYVCLFGSLPHVVTGTSVEQKYTGNQRDRSIEWIPSLAIHPAVVPLHQLSQDSCVTHGATTNASTGHYPSPKRLRSRQFHNLQDEYSEKQTKSNPLYMPMNLSLHTRMCVMTNITMTIRRPHTTTSFLHRS
jgi:hypothetical protein